MSGYFPQQQSWPWMQGSPYGGQQQGYGNAWPGMQGGYGGGWGGNQSFGQWNGQMATNPEGGGMGVGQLQQGSGPNWANMNAIQSNGNYQNLSGGYQPQAQATQGPDLGARRQRLNNQIGNLQQQYAAAGTQDQGAIQQHMQNLQARLGVVKGQVQDNRQAARQQANAPAPAPGTPQPQQSQGGGGYNYTPPSGPGVSTFNQPGGAYGYINHNAQPGQVAASIGTDTYNTQFGNLVPSSSGNANLYKVAGSGEGPGQTFAWQNGQWQHADNTDALAHQYVNAPTGPASGQVMQNSQAVNEAKLRAQGLWGGGR